MPPGPGALPSRPVDAVTELDHPLANVLLTRLRDAGTQPATFRTASHRLALLLVGEALRAVPTAARSVRTPLEDTEGSHVAAPIVAVPVLRAGLGLLDAVTALAPEADIGLIGVRRDERTFTPQPYVTQLPPLAGALVLVLEPMLATGGSADHAVACCAEAATVVVVSVVAAPEGLRRLHEKHPRVRVVVAGIDDGLDDHGFIVPGLGDFGDRLLGT